MKIQIKGTVYIRQLDYLNWILCETKVPDKNHRLTKSDEPREHIIGYYPWLNTAFVGALKHCHLKAKDFSEIRDICDRIIEVKNEVEKIKK